MIIWGLDFLVGCYIKEELLRGALLTNASSYPSLLLRVSNLAAELSQLRFSEITAHFLADT